MKRLYWTVIWSLLLTSCDADISSSGGKNNCDFSVNPLLITEISAGRDETASNWVELHNNHDRLVHINRSVLWVNDRAHLIMASEPLASGDYLVIGSGNEPFIDLHMANLKLPDRARLRLQCRSDKTEAVLYDGNALLGVSYQLEKSAMDEVSQTNDPMLWCNHTDGTPGQENTACIMHECEDPLSGELRPIRFADAGALVFTELFSNPEDGLSESVWLELSNVSGEDFDLNGMVLEQEGRKGAKRRWRFSSDQCMVAPRSYVTVGVAGETVFPRDVETDAVIHGPKIAKKNAFFRLYVFPYDEELDSLSSVATLIDEAAIPAPPVGLSSQLSSAVQNPFSANDNPASWCAAASDPVTPGQANAACP